MSMYLLVVAEDDLIISVLNASLTLTNPIMFMLLISPIPVILTIQEKFIVEVFCDCENKVLELLVVFK